MEWRWGLLYTKLSKIRIGFQRLTMVNQKCLVYIIFYPNKNSNNFFLVLQLKINCFEFCCSFTECYLTSIFLYRCFTNLKFYFMTEMMNSVSHKIFKKYHGSPLYTPPATSTSTWELAKTTILRNIEQYPGASKVAF